MKVGPPLLRFQVGGDPKPQGSVIAVWPRFAPKCPACKRGLGRSLLIPSNDRVLRPWRKQVAAAAKEATAGGGWPQTGAVWVRAEFVFVRPKSHRPDSVPSGRIGDVDKLARSVLDSLTGPVVADDAQVVLLTASKVYGPAAGVRVSVGLAY